MNTEILKYISNAVHFMFCLITGLKSATIGENFYSKNILQKDCLE